MNLEMSLNRYISFRKVSSVAKKRKVTASFSSTDIGIGIRVVWLSIKDKHLQIAPRN